jgi:hypothetical protein
MAKATSAYPVTFSIDYPNRNLNRLSTFFRGILIIPAAVIVGLLSGPWWGTDAWRFPFATGSFLFIPLVLMILFRQHYPRWWFDWNLAFTRFSARIGVYAALLNDEYPSTEREQSVHIKLPFPDAKKDLMRGMPLVKWFLAIPHWFLLCFLVIAAGFCVFISWFAILFTGRFPKSLFTFVVGVGRWGTRVVAYALLLVTDVYPPFSLE